MARNTRTASLFAMGMVLSLVALEITFASSSSSPSSPSVPTRFNMTVMGAYQHSINNDAADARTVSSSSSSIRSTVVEEEEESSWSTSSSEDDDDGDDKIGVSAMIPASSSLPQHHAKNADVPFAPSHDHPQFTQSSVLHQQGSSSSNSINNNGPVNAAAIRNAANNNVATLVKETNNDADAKLLVPPPRQLPKSLSFFRSQFSPRAPVTTTQSYFESAFSADSDSENGGGNNGLSSPPVAAAVAGQSFYPPRRRPTWQSHGQYIDDIFRDVDQLQNLHLDDDLTTPCHVVLRDKNYTRTWTHDDWEEYQVHALTRYWRHTLSLPYSTTARGVLPCVGVTFLYGLIVAYLTKPPTGLETLLQPLTNMVKRASSSLSSNALGMLVTPMGMLLALKAQRAMDRLLEARREWGRMIRTVRTLSGLIMAHVTPTNPEMGFLMARYLICFAWSFKALLRQENDEPLLASMLPYEESEWTLQQPHHPMAIICRIRYLLKEWLRENKKSMETAGDLHGELEQRLCDLEQVIGICNRIVTSPIPPTYTRHTSRVLSLFLTLLPLSLAGMGLGKVAIVFTSTVITYIFAGIDEIGVEIEFPFWLLPMTNLATAAQKSVLGQITMMHTMPRLMSPSSTKAYLSKHHQQQQLQSQPR